MHSLNLYLLVLVVTFASAVDIPVRKMHILIVKGEILYSYMNGSKTRRLLDASMSGSSELWNSYDPLKGDHIKTMRVKEDEMKIVTAHHGDCSERPVTLLDKVDNIVFPILGLFESIDMRKVILEPMKRVVRGISCADYSCVDCVAGEHIPRGTTVIWAIQGDIEKTVREVSVIFPHTGSDDYPQLLTVSVAWLSHIAGLDDDKISLSSCTYTIANLRLGERKPSEKRAFTKTEDLSFPKLPPNFRALVETTIRGDQESFLIEEEFSSSTTVARVRFIDKYLDVAGRSVRNTFVMDGNSQTTYHQIIREIPRGQSPAIEDGIRQYFWPADNTCTKTIFGFNSMSGTTAKLLLVPDTPIMRMGKAIVRGIETDYWQVNTGVLVIRWFFAEQEPQMTHRPLVRMIVKGRDSAPHLFPSHPFYQRSEPFPSKYATSACKALFPGDSACWQEESSYHYMYDFYGFGESRSLYGTFDVPYACRHTESINSYPPSSSCRDSSFDNIALLMFFGIGAGLGGLIMYIRMRRRLPDTPARSEI